MKLWAFGEGRLHSRGAGINFGVA